MSQEPNIIELDLRSITRDSDLVQTKIEISNPYASRNKIGILCGWTTMQRTSPSDSVPEYMIGARLSVGVTDFEHDSAWAFRFSVLALNYENTFYSHRWNAVISPIDGEDFHIPGPGYDPANMEGARDCKRCTPSHRIVPENHYVPPTDSALWRRIRGWPVIITSSIVRED